MNAKKVGRPAGREFTELIRFYISRAQYAELETAYKKGKKEGESFAAFMRRKIPLIIESVEAESQKNNT
jgi:hypothetical protein